MADKKISQLTSATTPLAGTEVLPIVQSGTTVKVSAENVVKATQPGSTAKTIPYLNASKIPTNGTELQFDGANLGIGVAPTIPSQGVSFEMSGGTSLYSRDVAGVPQSYLSSNAVGTGFSPVYKQNGYAAQYVFQGFDGSHAFATAPNGVAGAAVSFTNRLTISNAGDITANTGNFVVGTAGKGIDFSANGGDVLTQYDEGTFTPTISSGATGITYVAQSGWYTRIGRVVTFGLNIVVSAASAAAANFKVGGLPFTASAFGSGSFAYDNGTFINSLTTNMPMIFVTSGTTEISFFQGDGSQVQGTNISAIGSMNFYIVGSYIV